MTTQPNEALVEEVRDALCDLLGDTYDCTRVWSAWSFGTMGPDDFEPASERADEIARAIIPIVQKAVEGEIVAWFRTGFSSTAGEENGPLFRNMGEAFAEAIEHGEHREGKR